MSGDVSSFFGSRDALPPDARLECGICWWVYDPADGDALGNIPPGVPFSALPAHWVCPGCEAGQHKFMRVTD
ncbi:rubredoxin [Zoogloea sp.]|uniref:rubredoxin n=1 Tax=Zoogloea sp. TaxID=49181 RepID=UPI001AC0DFD7|nr:rubredoxin [Zoogloea sp.]MBN8284135.1 rubredoxin [Zoogloea sp.]